tara:strand:+ start:88 stop:981 length:894 start_codon:yes stop_codon:yes gene_type:complete
MSENDKALNEIVTELIAERKRNYRNKILFRSLLAGLILLVLFLAPLLKDANFNTSHLAVIEINGLISSNSEASAKKIIPLLKKANMNENSAAIIIKINSGGGSATQSKIIFDEIIKIKNLSDKKIISVIEDVGASGGYYIAMAADQILASETSIVGSIGVRLDNYDARSLFNKLGIKSRTIYSGDNKLILDPFHELTSEQYNHVKELTDQIHLQFINDLKKSRINKIDSENQLIYSGLFYTGIEAKSLGLIDEISSIYDLNNEEYKNIPLHIYNQDKNLFDQLIQSAFYYLFQSNIN